MWLRLVSGYEILFWYTNIINKKDLCAAVGDEIQAN
jgi:hypothetical protein